MTLFEYLAIAFGLLFSMTALRLVGGLPAALDPDRRYWVHLALLIVLLVSSASGFWTFWSMSGVQWTFPRFALALGMPAVMYFNACALVPADPADVPSWRDYYFGVRTRLFAGVAAWAVVAAFGATVNLGMPIAHPARVVQALVAAIGLAGWSSSRARVHEGLAVLFAVVILLVAASVGAEAGWLTR